ncbi:uncharacterized protein DUF4352 [Nocardiopsis sp. Huas11]|uniref:DUF4352 domain-containing protein n=1 Tax=Nocardiopsis sp. Huas11 TaxID=2183912 RepID=UPI000EAF682E|nr:DUF4352 domain-containing protein [Nocardiopsis sp. Huas11]RKS09512.1 uncharacterized protein DUF4352 [Nocardiopsis sp. Huas11]
MEPRTQGRPPPRSPRRRLTFVLAATLAVLLAAAAGTALAFTLSPLWTRPSQVAVQEPERPPEQEGPSEQEEPSPSRPPATDPPTASDTAEAVPESVPPEAYTGASTRVGTLRLDVERCYTDTHITDGFAFEDDAPEGMEFHIFRLTVTNEGNAPTTFDTAGTTGTTTEGRILHNDPDAEFTVAWDYFWNDIEPGTSVTSYVLFTAPTGTEFAEVLVSGEGLLEPDR